MALFKLDSETIVDTATDLIQFPNKNEMKDYIDVTHGVINLPKTLGELNDCGRLIQFAYAASKDHWFSKQQIDREYKTKQILFFV